MVFKRRDIFKLSDFFAFILFLIICPFLNALEIPEQTARVMDKAGVISGTAQSGLEDYLSNLSRTKDVQAAVLTVTSLEKEAGEQISIEEYASAVFEKWKPGQKNKDNGVLLLVSIEDRLVRIETGYGLEGVLTDTKCGLIIRKVIIPHFKSGDYEKGIIEGVKTVCAVAAGDEESADEPEQGEEKSEKNGSSVFAFIPFIFWGIFILIVVLTKKYGKKNNDGSDDDDDTNSRGRPFFGDPCSGSGWFGPRGGFGGGPGHGGFSGGGGGRSGGGGASGRW